jgi:hypothetical protein
MGKLPVWLCAFTLSCVGVIGSVRAGWDDTGIFADWGARDFACSQGATPKDNLCTAATNKFVAVCWVNRQTGECGNATAWCTYKSVTNGHSSDRSCSRAGMAV